MNGSRASGGAWAPRTVAALSVAFAATFAALALLRHRAFYTARFDLGNMTQAVWSLANGHGFTVTDPAGEQISRLSAHVEPILLAFVPLWKVWPDSRMLMIVQAIAVATIAIPTYLLARHWLDDRVTSVAFAAASLMLPAVQWATLFDFHPVTLAAPLLMWAIWAAVTGRILVLLVCAGAALMTKEQVGLAVAILGVWIAVRLGRRLVGWALAATSLAWTAIAVSVIVPHFRDGAASPFIEERYGDLGSSASEVVWSVVTRPWDAVGQAMSADRFAYMAATLLPLIVVGAFAPLLAAGALPDLVLNLLSSSNEQHSIEYHYGAVIAPFLLASAILGCATLRRRGPGWARRFLGTPRRLAGALVGTVLIGGWLSGPLPFWQYLPGGSDRKSEEYAATPRSARLAEAVRQIPPDVPVSAGNRIGGHLSERQRILTFPTIADAQFVVVDTGQPDVGDILDAERHATEVARMRARTDFRVSWERGGVIVFTRVSG